MNFGEKTLFNLDGRPRASLLRSRDMGTGSLLSLALLLFYGLLFCQVWCKAYHHVFHVKEASYTRLCKAKKMLTVNGQFPGPTLYAHRGDKLLVEVHNRARENVTIHWHGVKQPRNPSVVRWPPIHHPVPYPAGRDPLSSTTSRSPTKKAPSGGTPTTTTHEPWFTVPWSFIPDMGPHIYPFPKPSGETVVVLGEWWKRDVNAGLEEALETGDPNASDAYTINGQPGDLYPCSKPAG